MTKQKMIDLKKYPPHMRMDYERRNNNVKAGRKLCKRCDGTGNEFYSMYSKCLKCGGDGIAKEKNGKAKT